MSDIVTGMPAAIGYTNTHGHHGHHGWSDKDQSFATAIDAGERTRDILAAIYGGTVATEKTGAASSE